MPPTPAPFETGIPVPPAAQAALEALAEQLGVDPGDVIIREIEQVQWSNTCLGVEQPDEACGEMIVDGFRVVLEAEGKEAVFHTNFDGSQVREAVGNAAQPIRRPTPGRTIFDRTPVGKPVEGEMPAAVGHVIDLLATENSLRPDDVRVVSVEEVMWSDSCLGVNRPGMMCLQVITPGYRITVEAGGKQYVYHTDDAGGKIVPAGAPMPTSQQPAVVWEQTSAGLCTRAEIGFQFVQYGPCGGTLKQVELTDDRAKELAELADVYGSFEAGTRAGVLTFRGNGTREPSAVEQRAIAQWARSLRQELENGAEDVQPAITWTREGGIAGFCDAMTITSGGWVYATTCKSASQEPTVYRLNEEQLEMLFGWVDKYASFTVDSSDPAGVADGMKVQFTFTGGGQQKASKDEQGTIMAFVENLYAAK